MDNQKVEQVLKEIFTRYGIEIVHRHDKRFEAAISDLLDEGKYKEERAVLRRASESTALWVLLNTKAITGDGAEKAVECLERESRMTREDAVFVVSCAISARGGNPKIVKSQRSGGVNGVGTGSQNTVSKAKVSNTSTCLLEAPCSMSTNRKIRGKKNFKGKLYLYSNRLKFIPNKRGEEIQLNYQDIVKMNTFRIWMCIGSIISLFAIIISILMLNVGEEVIGALMMWFIAFPGLICAIVPIKSLTLYSNLENELGYKIFYGIAFQGAHKKRAIEILKKGIQGQL